MSSRERITIRQYDTTDDARAAEALLQESGVPQDMITRSGKKISVDALYAGQARGLLGSVTTEGETMSVGNETGVASSAVNTAQSAVASVADTAQSAASTVVDSAQDVAGTVADTAQDVAGAVADKVQDVTGAVTSQVGKVADVAAGQVEQLADTARQGAINADAPAAQREVAETAANVLDKTATYLREGDINVMLNDLRDLVRRHPLRSLALGLGLGYLARGAFFPEAEVPSIGSGGRQSPAPSYPPFQPQAVPVYAETPMDIGAGSTLPSGSGMSMGVTAPPVMETMPGSIDTDVTRSDAIANDTATLPDSLLYGTDATLPGDIVADEIGTGATGSSASTVSTSDDFMVGSDDVTSGLSATGSGASGGMGDTLAGDLGTGTIGSGVSGGMSDTFGGDLGGTAAQGGAFGAGNVSDSAAYGTQSGLTDDMSTGQQSSSALDDVLQEWDTQTRRKNT